MVFPTHHILEGYTKQPARKRKYDDLIYIIFFKAFKSVAKLR